MSVGWRIADCARGRRLLGGVVLAVVVLAVTEAGARTIGEARKVVGDVQRLTVKQPARTGDALIFAETVRTEDDSALDVRLLDDTTLAIGENAQLTLDSLVYDPRRNAVEGVATMVTGMLHFASAGAKMDFVIRTPVATIGVRGTVFDVLTNGRETEVAVRSGTVEVTSASGTARVGPGQVYRANSQGGGLSDDASAAMTHALDRLSALLFDSDDTASDNARGDSTFLRDDDETDNASADAVDDNDRSYSLSDIAGALTGRDPEQISLLETSKGVVVIELRPDLAPRHVARIKELIRDGFYDGQKFTFVRPGYVAEIGSVRETGRRLAPEFSREPVVRGSVGMSRQGNDPNSADSRFFIALGRARVLDGNYTLWGNVIQGMATLDRLAVGKPPRAPDRILTLRIASDVLDR